jgi:hypothetical protein
MSKKSSRWVPVLRTAVREWRPPCCPPPPRRCRGCRSSSGWARGRRSGCCRCCCLRPRRDPANPGAAARAGCRHRLPAASTRGSGTWRSPAANYLHFRALSSFYGWRGVSDLKERKNNGKLAKEMSVLFLRNRIDTLQRHNTDLRGLSPNFTFLSVRDLYIPRIGILILQQEHMWTESGNI